MGAEKAVAWSQPHSVIFGWQRAEDNEKKGKGSYAYLFALVILVYLEKMGNRES